MGDYSSYSDSELIALFNGDDDAAFKEIYQRYDKLLYIFAYRKLDDEDEAMDVVQDVFTGMLANRGNFMIKASLSAYLYKSVLNKILDLFRHQQTIKRYIAEGSHYIDVDTNDTDYLIREKDIREMIEKEIAAMPPRMRQAYELKHKFKHSPQEIAEQMGISEHTVKVQLQRALKHLRNRLGVVIFVIFILNK
ncbi:RNA polymerase sigma factor [Mucilaginibacter auburnensis]|uniref:RNA polymerase sigma-70 factor (ECF subfamily) n=1 Tax=Mucilaginibacter auburnensis TaxID=1457233 RepID=A0A2H9VW61_9SPHI|nr:RNA polymerase sigma-70 factor [Mucilaginibacter auburnensis]PJJ85019.1 RNA polymerase sigma-70 factor (ECF subfamily) [Mucilaginibacter auburnensis]